jgi:hypothetical protein
MHDLGASMGGKCLSGEYINARTKLIWQCSVGHVFELVPSKIKNQGLWCRKCKTAKD